MDAAEAWSQSFGLALSPLFEADDPTTDAQHRVLLNGGLGTFALSITEEELWKRLDLAGWAWSSDIAHHVTLTRNKVAVIRWDRPRDAKVYDRDSVERGLDRFYSYLCDDRPRSNKTVVDHLLGLFRRLRSLSHAAKVPDDRATAVFTATLAQLIAPEEAPANPDKFGLPADAFELQAKLSGEGLASAIEEIRCATGSLSQLVLHPALTVRHASGLLFQEAHFELLRAPESSDLFGLIGAPELSPVSRGGTHYTPPALARSVVEQALGTIDDLSQRSALTVCDPACGSGAFLHEALRALRRMRFDGHLTLVGQDQSAAAVTMAEFVLRTSLRDWSPSGGVELALRSGDSLAELGMPQCDVIIMNPPFISSGSQTALQREQLKQAVGSTGASRGDFSMAFISRALQALNDGGVLGTLFPASLLSLKAATEWRESLANAGELRLLASIGDFGLFAHALVQVACAVIRKTETPKESEFTAMITQNEPRATSEALRWLRKSAPLPPSQPIVESGWSIFPVPPTALRNKATWRLSSPATERVLRLLVEAQLPTVGDLFHVRQGVLTGLNKAFLLDRTAYESLPNRERKYFRLATMTDSIQSGIVTKRYYVFYPHDSARPLFEDESELRKAVPRYFHLYLEPHKKQLSERAALTRADRTDWWGLNWPRSWGTDRHGRIITKFFGAEGAFVADVEAEYLPVMGHAWFLKNNIGGDVDEEAVPLAELLSAYATLLNSEPFARLLAIYSPHVAGGQFDLSARHVDPIPLPNLGELSQNPALGRAISELANAGRRPNPSDPIWRATVTSAVLAVYGTPALAEL
jgi:hypothetical protein